MRRGREGFVLVTVLWVLAILTVISVGFQRRALLDARAAQFTLDHAQAMFLARGAVERGLVEIRNKAVIDALYKQAGRTSRAQHWAHPIDMLKEGAYYTAPGEDYADEICQYQIRDEDSLICINAADENVLNNIEGLSLAVVRKIMRRRMGDLDAKEPPQPFQAIEELRNIKEIQPKAWFGDEKQVGLRELLTCWGDGHININTASREVLECIPDLNEDIIRAIINFRTGPDGELGTEDDQDFPTLGDVGPMSGTSGEALGPLQQYCKVDSQYFTIRGVATRRHGKVLATCVATVVLDPPNAWIIKWREEFLES